MALVSDLQLTIGRLLSAGRLYLRAAAGERVEVESDFRHTGSKLGFHGTLPITKQTIAGGTGNIPAVESMAAALAAMGLVTNNTSSGGTVVAPPPTTNASPSVSFNAVSGAVAGTAFTLSGSYSDPDGTVDSVVIKRGTTTLGNATLSGGTWSYSVTESTAGDYTYTATATDNAGATATASRTVTVAAATATGGTPVTTNYSTYPDGATGTDFTSKWSTTGHTYLIVSDAAFTGGKRLEEKGDANERIRFLRWNPPGTALLDMEILARYRPTVQSGGTDRFGLVARGSGGSGSQLGYELMVTRAEGETATRIRIAKSAGGAFLSTAAPFDVAPLVDLSDATKFYMLRFRIVAGALKAKAWDAALAEPAAWMIDIVDPDPITTTGGAGTIIRRSTQTIDWDTFSVTNLA